MTTCPSPPSLTPAATIICHSPLQRSASHSFCCTLSLSFTPVVTLAFCHLLSLSLQLFVTYSLCQTPPLTLALIHSLAWSLTACHAICLSVIHSFDNSQSLLVSCLDIHTLRHRTLCQSPLLSRCSFITHFLHHSHSHTPPMLLTPITTHSLCQFLPPSLTPYATHSHYHS